MNPEVASPLSQNDYNETKQGNHNNETVRGVYFSLKYKVLVGWGEKI